MPRPIAALLAATLFSVASPTAAVEAEPEDPLLGPELPLEGEVGELGESRDGEGAEPAEDDFVGPPRPSPPEKPRLPAVSPWSVPPPDTCAPASGLRGLPFGEDAPPLPFQPGDSILIEQLDLLKDFLPPQVWDYRERFFYEGMRLEIGPCFADYGPPPFYVEATQNFRGRARLLENGGLADYVAGLPFARHSIPADDPQAGLKWAWNTETRYQGAGFRGKFRTTDMVGRSGRAEPFIGELFKTHLAFRADRAEDGYTAPGARNKHWVAGGVFTAPFDAREFAWRQYRDVEHLEVPNRTDDLHAYVPQMRRVRRLSGADIEGIYMPSFSVGVVKAESIAVMAGGLGEGGGSGGGLVGGAPAPSAGTISTKRSGFEGLELRPLLYDYAILGVQDVLAPLAARTPSYPEEEERDFGTWGLSFASDTWDLRRSLVLEGTAKSEVGGERVARLILYVDLQTLTPLYYVSHDSRDELIDVGMYVGRWSETRRRYPRWPDDRKRPIRVIDPVGAAFANIRETGGWRRESWEIVSTPPKDKTVKNQISVNNLTKRR